MHGRACHHGQEIGCSPAPIAGCILSRGRALAGAPLQASLLGAPWPTLVPARSEKCLAPSPLLVAAVD